MSHIENKWQEVWLRKGAEEGLCDLESLMRADGFDAGTGAISVEDWLKSSTNIQEKLELKKGSNVLEVGCGAGAMLWTLKDQPVNIFGVDYSKTLIQKAKEALPELKAEVCEASSISYQDKMFDAVFSHGVFFYFSDYEYAQKAMDEIVRVLKDDGKIYILDVPDLEKREECETFRRDVVYSGEEYPTAEDGAYRHLYYSKSWFAEFGARNGMQVEFFDQDLESYPMSPYRFNALLKF